MEVNIYSDLFLNSEDSDFEAHVETLNGTMLVFPVHGFALERGSDVFKTMLQKDKFKEGTSKVLEIKVPGNEEDAIFFFRYLYNRKLGNLDIPSYIVLLQLAHLYEVNSLAVSCVSRLKELVTPISVCRVYISLDKVAPEDFLMYCKKMMLSHAFFIFMENLHTILNEDTMNFLLKSDSLNLLNEEQAVCALWMWARVNCLSETKITEELFKVTLDKLKPCIRWSKITNLTDAPWYNLVEENKKRSVTNEKDRLSNPYIPLNQFSKILNDDGFEDVCSHLQRRYARQDFWGSDLLFNPQNNDFEAHVEMQSNGKKLVIPVHGFILRRASDILKAMVEKDRFKEGVTKVIQIKIPGDEADVETFFRYLYTKKLGQLDIRSYITLMQVAHLYEIRSLLQLCEKRIVDVMTPFSVCQVYCSLEEIASENTLVMCKDIMLRFAFILFTEYFHLMLKEETMKFLLESDELNLMDEEQALSALWSWARTKCLLESTTSKENVGDTLKKLLYLVRWPMINIREMDAPWVDLMQDNKHLIGNEINARLITKKISLKQYSNVLVFSESDDLQQPETLKIQQAMVNIDITFDVLLTGLTILIKYSRLPNFNLTVNNKNVTSNVTRNEVQIKSENVKNEYFVLSRMTLEFTKPILLSSLHSNKIIVSTGSSVVLPTYYGAPNKKYTNSDSGRVLNVELHSQVTGIQKLYYMIWK